MNAPMQLELLRVNKHYGGYHALRDVEVSIPKGAFVALVGPSGCGKSTLLRTIAGLETISSGDIRIAGASVAKLPPRRRDVAMVFQSYALYPHMTVERNMNYALHLRRQPAARIREATQAAARMLGLDALLGRFPRELSGGQRQRVAMGRAIVRDPKLFLFDEPLSNLDAALRVHMRGEIRRLHERQHGTSVYVTHDQIEAMTMADHIVVMRQGVVEQQGAPLDLYDRPANVFVAGFIGSPAMNMLPAVVDGSGSAARLAGVGALPLCMRATPGRGVLLGLRPEHLRVAGPDVPDAFEARVEAVESTGSMTFLKLDAAGQALIVTIPERRGERPGDRLRLRSDTVHVFDQAAQTRLEG
jgi:multiple sugar transport system ATP-binding protein